MQGALAIMAVAVVMAATYFVFRLLGPRRPMLLLPLSEKKRWDTTVVPNLGRPLVAASLVGSLTSLATAYLFFIGTSKIFGYWVFACPVAIFVGAFVTNLITRTLLTRRDIAHLIIGGTQQSGVIARIFWNDSASGKAVARIAKWISLTSALGVIWLEFAIFGDIFGFVLGTENLFTKGIICGLAAYVVANFTLRYGLRGFIFADAFHAPVLAAAVAVLVTTTVVRYLLAAPRSSHHILELANPLVTPTQGMFFMLHVLVLNSFLVVFTEAHWLRLWTLTSKPVIKTQVRGAGATAVIWAALSLCGLFGYELTGMTGDQAAIRLVSTFPFGAGIIAAIFWLGAGAALFATSDIQLYSALLLRQFNPQTGSVEDEKFEKLKPTRLAAGIALIFFCIYTGVRFAGLPFEKIIFIIVPFSLNMMPAFAALLTHRTPRAAWMILSLSGYLVCATFGFFLPATEYAWTLAASLAPVLVSVAILLSPRNSSNE